MRHAAGKDVFSLADRAHASFAGIKNATVMAFVPPAILEMGNALGFDLCLQDNVGLGHEGLMAARPVSRVSSQEPGAYGRPLERHG